MPLEWTCESIRLSLFSTNALAVVGDDWTALTNQAEAEREQKQAGRRLFSSQLMGGQLGMSSVANRVDIILSPSTKVEDMSEDNLPSVGRWPTCFEPFRQATEEYLRKFNLPIQRIAFGLVLLSVHRERLDAYKALASQIKSISHAPEVLQDLLFRINWPQNSTADNTLSLNRLTTWQVLQMQLQVVVPDGNSPSSFVNPLAHVMRLELDHSTDGGRTEPFDGEQLVPIYRDLANLALQNAEQGEVQ
jgi:hypothetical protein